MPTNIYDDNEELAGTSTSTIISATTIAGHNDRVRTRTATKNDWRTVASVCWCFFFIHCQPSESYLSKFLREDKNITEADMDLYVWPVDTWAALLTLIPIGLAAEVWGYKRVAVAGLLCR